MDKNAIKKYAVWARRELIEKVSQKAIQYGIENSNELDPNADSINGKLLTDIEKRQRQALIKKINEDGFEQVIEEVAYTWFNRFVALRFMEVNGYLPSHIRVFTDENNCFNPQILTEALHVDLESLDREKVLQMKEANQDDELYKCLIIAQCNDLSAILPGLFQKISDYTELLLPDYLLRKGSVIEELVDKIPEDNFNVDSENGQVEIIGWMYQYYNDEKKSYVINLKNSAVKRDDVPAATQLFTTDWVVRYIADNTIGRYWVEHNGGDVYKSLTYYVGDADKKYDAINPKDLTVFDPCVGSGHFLVYAFDVLLKIYLEFGYSERDAAKEIVENNLFGIDIDARATQLAYFAVMMKARACDRRFFSRNCRPNIYEIKPSDHVDQYALEYFCKGNEELRKDITTVLNRFDDAKEYGSVLKACDVNWGRILQRTEEVYEDIDIYRETVIRDIIPIINAAYVLSSKYAVVITNPPYLNKYSPKLKKYVTDNYKDYSGDLFSVFIYRNFLFCKEDGYTGFMTPYVWMFIKTYEKLRQFIINSKSITSLIQMEYSAFEEATVPICSFVLSNKKSNEPGSYFKLSSFKGGMEVQKQKVLEAIDNKKCGYYYERQTDIFRKIPGSPIAFWAGDNTFLAYDKEKIADSYIVRNGISTGDNDRFLRLWHEVDNTRDYWKPCNKGGSFRKWYGNNEYVVYWKDDGHEIRTNLDDKGRIKARLGGIEFSFQEGIEMSRITSGELGFRFSFPGFVYESSTNDIYVNSNRDLYTLLGYCNSAVVSHFLGLMNPTINIMPEDLRGLPCFEIEDKKSVTDMVVRNIEVSKEDWDSYETSWDFVRHPLIKGNSIEEAYKEWEKICSERFKELKTSEESLNSIFITAYGVEDELQPEIEDRLISINRADLQKDIRSLISYAVGCMFGRYSLDKDGLVFAGGEVDKSAYTSYLPDEDGIIPICDDEYFSDDIVGRFVEFIQVVYGKESLEDNLQFIADAIGGNGSSRDIIRNYFINDFYADHVKIYQKRPIYWLFDSGKKNGFKCLIYMHRYQPDTIARIRTDYVHEQQARYRTAIEETEKRIESANGSDKVKLTKKLNTLKAQDEEIHAYEEKIHHLADQMISIDLDDGVKHNYEIFKDVLAKIK